MDRGADRRVPRRPRRADGQDPPRRRRHPGADGLRRCAAHASSSTSPSRSPPQPRARSHLPSPRRAPFHPPAAIIDGVPFGRLDEWNVTAVPIRQPFGQVVGVIVVGLPQPEGSLKPALPASRVSNLERFAELAAGPLATSLRFVKLRGTLDLVLRPQQEGIRSMAADVGGDYDKATRDYLLNSFTANVWAQPREAGGSLDGAAEGSVGRASTDTGAGSSSAALAGLERSSSIGSSKGARRRTTAAEVRREKRRQADGSAPGASLHSRFPSGARPS